MEESYLIQVHRGTTKARLARWWLAQKVPRAIILALVVDLNLVLLLLQVGQTTLVVCMVLDFGQYPGLYLVILCNTQNGQVLPEPTRLNKT